MDEEKPRLVKRWNPYTRDWITSYLLGECLHEKFNLDGAIYCKHCGEEFKEEYKVTRIEECSVDQQEVKNKMRKEMYKHWFGDKNNTPPAE